MVDQAWLILTSRYGRDTRNPSVEALVAAMREVFVEDLPGMQTGDYEEHGAAHLRRGLDDGPMHVLTVDCLHRVTFEEWADQDYHWELVPPRSIEIASQADALELCLLLARGDIDAIRTAMKANA